MLLQQTTIKTLTMVLMLALIGARSPGVGRMTPSPEFVISASEVATHLSTGEVAANLSFQTARAHQHR